MLCHRKPITFTRSLARASDVSLSSTYESISSETNVSVFLFRAEITCDGQLDGEGVDFPSGRNNIRHDYMKL